MEEVRAQIRFHLSELGTRNEHHTFERLCREFAKVRICRRILASTGPVSAGGDQGRDFETFRDYLGTCGLNTRSFVGVAAQGPLVFACTVQRQRLMAKMSADLTKIVAGALRPERVYFLLAANVADSVRHAIQKTGADQSVMIEVIDQQTLSEQLSELDLFWIAEEYLHIPSEIYPPMPADPQRARYEAMKREWSTRAPNEESFADFEELKRSLRLASRDVDLRGDVDLFCRKVQCFRSSPIEWLRRRAIYEEVVAHVHSFNSLRGDEMAIREYFSTVPDDGNAFKDSVCLLFFVFGAWKRTVVELGADEIERWRRELVRSADVALRSKTATRSERCVFLEHRGQLCLIVFAGGELRPAVEQALRYWNKMLKLLDGAPLFPLEEFSRYVNEMAPLVAHESGYREFVTKLDQIVTKRVGRRAAADSAYQRALAWRRAGKEREAINELHAAKVDWFSDETLGLCALSMLEISQWYSGLGLSCAGKYYAMAASYITFQAGEHELLRLAARALLVVADCEYGAGAWAGFLVWAKIALPVLTRVESQTSEKLGSEIDRLAFHGFTALLACQLCDLSELAPRVREFIKNIGFDEAEEEVLPKAAAIWPDRERFLKDAREQLGGVPFGDVNSEREIAWSALGIQWSVTFPNDYDTAAKAEEFVALFQILLADLSGIDLCLLPTTVSVSMSVGEGSSIAVTRVPRNAASEWQVVVPRTQEIDAKDLLPQCFKVLREVSLVPDREFFAVLERVFANGLSAKVFVARAYRDLVFSFVKRTDFDAFPRTDRERVRTNQYLREHPDVAWIGGLRSDYDRQESERTVRRRYDRALDAVRLTLPKLRRSTVFKEGVRRLREQGWKDWHILMGIAAAAANARANIVAGPPRSFEEAKKAAAEFYRPERSNDPDLPEELFSFESLERQILFNLSSSAKALGLELHQATPNLGALRRLLAERYNYMTDDVPHASMLDEGMDHSDSL